MVLANTLSSCKSLYSSPTRGKTQTDTRSVSSEQVPKASLILSLLEEDPMSPFSIKFLVVKVDFCNALQHIPVNWDIQPFLLLMWDNKVYCF